MQESVEVCDAPSATLVGLRAQVNPGSDIDDARLMVAANPWSGATVIAEVAVAPASALTLFGLAVTAKSLTVTVTSAEWDRDPLVAVAVTV